MSATYPDAYLDHFAERWIAHQLWRYGVPLETYLRDPHGWDAMLGDHPHPLLEAQRQVRERLDGVEAALRRCLEGRADLEDVEVLERHVAAARRIHDLPRRGGVPTEPLHHRRWPRTRSLFRRALS